MGTWNALSSIVTVLAGCGVALLAAGCLWPGDPAAPHDSSCGSNRCEGRPRTVAWPSEWSCACPDRPFTLAEAHLWMQFHRDHDCPRKQSAFAALVAAGRIQPDSSRRARWSRTDD